MRIGGGEHARHSTSACNVLWLRHRIARTFEQSGKIVGLVGCCTCVSLSSPERAFVEMAAEVPKKAPLGELYQLMEFADTLRPNLVMDLLSQCESIKAKRIFMFLAGDLGLWWSKKLFAKGVR